MQILLFVHSFYLYFATISQTKCAILDKQKLEQISSFEEAEFRNVLVRNGSYLAYSDTSLSSYKQRSLPHVQINDDPVPRFLDGKWIRGNIAVDKRIRPKALSFYLSKTVLEPSKLFWTGPKLIFILDAVQKEKFKFVHLASFFMVQTVLKVSKSQKHFFLKLHCPKNKQNIRQNSAL